MGNMSYIMGSFTITEEKATGYIRAEIRLTSDVGRKTQGRVGEKFI